MGGFSLNPFFNKILSQNCDDFVIKTQLFSPVPIIVNSIKIGDELNIGLMTPAGPCIASYHGEIAGTIMCKNMFQLIDCIQRGKVFIAIVRDIFGGNCSITIQLEN